MLVLLTVSCVALVVGLLLLVLGFASRRASSPGGFPVAPEPAADVMEPTAGTLSPSVPADRPRRGIRPIPLVLGLFLAVAGAAGVGLILREGLESDRVDKWLLTRWPAGRLVEELDADDPRRRAVAYHELTRRYEANSLDVDVEKRLIDRNLSTVFLSEGDPNRPTPQAPLVEIDLPKARRDNKIDDATWGKFVARKTQFRYRVPPQASIGQPVAAQLSIALADPTVPEWVMLRFEELKLADKPIPTPQAVIIAPNPQWQPPEPTAEVAAGSMSAIDEPGAAPPPPRPAIRRMAIHEDQIAAELIDAVGGGAHTLAGRVHVYAFNPKVAPPPLELLTEPAAQPSRRRPPQTTAGAATTAATGPAADVPAVLTARLTAEQADALVSKASGKWEWTLSWPIEVTGASQSTSPEQPTTRSASQSDGPPTTRPTNGNN